MSDQKIKVNRVQFKAASDAEVDTGLLGWVNFCIGDLRLDGLSLRRTAAGRLAISFPARSDSSGRRHFFVRPLNNATRLEIEHQVFTALGLTDTSPSALEKM